MRGEDAGRKDRPCLVLAVTEMAVGPRVIVAPFTTRQYDTEQSVLVPFRVARHLQLDPGCRIICDDLNQFVWIGPDVRTAVDDTPFYGQVPAILLGDILQRVIANAVRPTRRTS